MDLLLKKSSPFEVKEHLLPMIIGSLNSTNHDVQVCTCSDKLLLHFYMSQHVYVY